MKKLPYFLLVLFIAGSLISCQQTTNQSQIETVEKQVVKPQITEQEVLDAQKTWGDGIVTIGAIFAAGGDYMAAAEKHIDELYGYQLGPVLFKPTLASQQQFRTTKEGALSYFVGHATAFPEDHGFAIKYWTAVRWESVGIKIEGNMAIAMGNYYFTPADGGAEVKVEYAFAYTKDAEGKLRIIMHGSFLPYSPVEKH